MHQTIRDRFVRWKRRRRLQRRIGSGDGNLSSIENDSSEVTIDIHGMLSLIVTEQYRSTLINMLAFFSADVVKRSWQFNFAKSSRNRIFCAEFTMNGTERNAFFAEMNAISNECPLLFWSAYWFDLLFYWVYSIGDTVRFAVRICTNFSHIKYSSLAFHAKFEALTESVRFQTANECHAQSNETP